MADRFLDFTDKTVLITGGTRGIGLETALVFAERGARCILTYRWGDHDEAELCDRFRAAGGAVPLFVQADAADRESTTELFAALKGAVAGIDIFISNVSSAVIINCFADYTLKGLKQSLAYSSWPMITYTQAIHAAFGRYPAYIIGVSSTGPDYYSVGYDFVAASKTVMEVLVKYLNVHLREHKVVINAVRSRAIKTKLFEDTFGRELTAFAEKLVPDCDNYWITPRELAEPIVALCSGYCDAISGQILTVDKGTTFFDNFMEFYTRYKKQAK
jgi:NAD(P)-dependent dehydrogenase (short-subunit alcohol dehydrogenase family)